MRTLLMLLAVLGLAGCSTLEKQSEASRVWVWCNEGKIELYCNTETGEKRYITDGPWLPEEK